jgi:microcystin degradation protein MlrC
MRGKAFPPILTPEAAIAEALMVASGPLVIADVWDNPGGGVAGDATVILRALIDARVENAALATIWDPVAVRLCAIAGEGARVPLRFGAKSAPHCGERRSEPGLRGQAGRHHRGFARRRDDDRPRGAGR